MPVLPGTPLVGGFTPPDNPYVNYTASGASNSYTQNTQIVELGNSLARISGTMTYAQELARDNQPNPDPNGFGTNNAPGLDLLNCLTKK